MVALACLCCIGGHRALAFSSQQASPFGERPVTLDSVTVQLGDTATLRLSIPALDASDNLLSYQFSIILPSGVTFISSDTSETMSGAAGGSLLANLEDHTLNLSFAGGDPMSGEGTLLKLLFTGDAIQTYRLTPIDVYLNSTRITIVNPGAITVVERGGPDEEVAAGYRSGWNLVGMPVDMTHGSYMELFPTAYANALFGFTQSYQFRQTLSPGEGYWLRLQAASDVVFSGALLNSVERALVAGWNLVSGPTTGVTVASIGDADGILSTGPVYGFSGSYIQVEDLEPGHGYWIRANAPGTIVLTGSAGKVKGKVTGKGEIDGGGMDDVQNDLLVNTSASTNTDSMPDPVTPSELQDHVMLDFRDGDRLASRLFFKPQADGPGDDNNVADPARYLLPPPPPAGIVDARFSDGSYAAWEPQVKVEVRQAGRSISMTLSASEAFRDAAFDIVEWHGPVELARHVIMAGDRIELHANSRDLTLRRQASESEIPEGYRLEQNHPNPFNPSTTIRFALPQAAQVRLEVFNVTGQRVAVLAAGPMPAGWHEARFEAAGLASGVYVYRLSTADGFSRSRRLLLVK